MKRLKTKKKVNMMMISKNGKQKFKCMKKEKIRWNIKWRENFVS